MTKVGLSTLVDDMRQALDDFSNAPFESVVPEVVQGGMSVNFDSARTSSQKRNNVKLLLGAIGPAKDHLKEWCKDNNMPFEGDNIIKNNNDVAVVHDLWNLDKHKRLNTKPRSGFLPTLSKPEISMNTSIPAGATGGVVITLSPQTGKMEVIQDGSGTVRLELNVEVFNGKKSIGQLSEICSRAIDVWAAEFKRVGAM